MTWTHKGLGCHELDTSWIFKQLQHYQLRHVYMRAKMAAMVTYEAPLIMTLRSVCVIVLDGCTTGRDDLCLRLANCVWKEEREDGRESGWEKGKEEYRERKGRNNAKEPATILLALPPSPSLLFPFTHFLCPSIPPSHPSVDPFLPPRPPAPPNNNEHKIGNIKINGQQI